MSIKYLSPEWMEENKKRISDVFNKPTRVASSLIEVYENCPDGKTMWVKMILKQGLLDLFEYGTEDIPEATFKIFGDYSEYVKVLKGEKDPQVALMTGAFTLEGNLMTALSQIGIYKKLIKIRQEMDTEY
jgi:hypothetical protein